MTQENLPLAAQRELRAEDTDDPELSILRKQAMPICDPEKMTRRRSDCS
jgi:hypothetical protein